MAANCRDGGSNVPTCCHLRSLLSRPRPSVGDGWRASLTRSRWLKRCPTAMTLRAPVKIASRDGCRDGDKRRSIFPGPRSEKRTLPRRRRLCRRLRRRPSWRIWRPVPPAPAPGNGPLELLRPVRAVGKGDRAGPPAAATTAAPTPRGAVREAADRHLLSRIEPWIAARAATAAGDADAGGAAQGLGCGRGRGARRWSRRCGSWRPGSRSWRGAGTAGTTRWTAWRGWSNHRPPTSGRRRRSSGWARRAARWSSASAAAEWPARWLAPACRSGWPSRGARWRRARRRRGSTSCRIGPRAARVLPVRVDRRHRPGRCR